MKRYQVSMLPPFDKIRPGIADMAPPRPIHPRPNYTLREAELVAHWLNGDDVPLPTMVTAKQDDFYRRYGERPLYIFGDSGETVVYCPRPAALT